MFKIDINTQEELTVIADETNGFPLLILKFQFNSALSLKAAHCKRHILYAYN